MPPGPSGTAAVVPVPLAPVTTSPACVWPPALDLTSVLFAQAARNEPATAMPAPRSSSVRRDMRPRTSFGWNICDTSPGGEPDSVDILSDPDSRVKHAGGYPPRMPAPSPIELAALAERTARAAGALLVDHLARGAVAVESKSSATDMVSA